MVEIPHDDGKLIVEHCREVVRVSMAAAADEGNLECDLVGHIHIDGVVNVHLYAKDYELGKLQEEVNGQFEIGRSS